MKKGLYSLLFILFPFLCTAQSTEISGVINAYTSVSTISGNDLTVSSSAEFTVGDLVLIIQMQGATLDETNTASFGTVEALNNAGNYEYGTICAITGPTTISLLDIQRAYDPAGMVQLIRVPVYTTARVTSTLTAMPWNGTTGGVLAFQCTDSLIMDAGIDVDGLGFRGGAVTTSTYSCSWLASTNDYYYTITSGEGAKKGEGIGQYILDKTGGRGAQTNGGGGGNDHNSGGGGGANAGAGGNGGERIAPSLFSCSGSAPGVGGRFNVFSNAANKVFLGGAGGAGHENNVGVSTRGANGAGIVMIKADVIVGNDETIAAKGEVLGGSVAADGAGGGGAGGTVLLDATTYSGTINVNVSGSDGGDVSNVGSSNCNGPGGGGGGGILWVNQATLPANVVLTNNGGVAGTTLASSQPGCTIGGTNNAQAGNDGVVLTDLVFAASLCSIPVNAVETSICATDSLFLAGGWQSTEGVYYDTLFTGCCDSIVETTLNIYPLSSGTDTQSACESFVWIDGITYTESNSTATQLLTSTFGCDSLVTLDLTITTVDVSVTNTDPSLTATATPATYRWLNCDNGFAVIPAATSAVFTATANGNYAVEVTQNGCVDTSSCYTIATVGVTHDNPFAAFRFYPNPSNGKIYLDVGDLKNVSVTIRNIVGQSIFQQSQINETIQIDLQQPAGVYFITVKHQLYEQVYKLIIE